MSALSSDPADLLVLSRPSDTRLEEAWPLAAREQLLERTVARARSADGRHVWTRRRAGLLAGAAAAGAATILAGPAILSPSQAPQASALTRLAGLAHSRPAVVIPAGKFLKMTVVERQFVSNPRTTTMVSWTDRAGNIWRKDSSDTGRVGYYLFPHPRRQSVNYPSPSYARTLPTDPAALEAYLRARVDGSTSKDEAVFTAIGDMLRLGYVPAAVRATAIKTLARLPEVSTTDVTVADARSGLRVDFVDNRRRPGEVQSLFFDRRTSALVEESLTHSGVTLDTEHTTSSAVVRSVPDVVRRRSTTMHE